LASRLQSILEQKAKKQNVLALSLHKKGSAMSRKIKFLLLSLIAIAIMLANPYKLIVVRGNSMYPTLKNGSILLGKKSNYFKRGDIIVAQNDLFEVIVKRIKYVGGDNYYYSFSKDSAEFTLIEDDSYANLYKIISTDNQSIMHLVVPKNQYYILGDNRNESDDSRRFGSINKESIIYKIVK